MAFKAVLAGLGAVLAAWLLWFGTDTHLQRACLELDTPYLPLCPNANADSDPIRKQELRARLHENPGDSAAWVTLAHFESGAPQQPLLRAVGVLAPSDPNSLKLRAKHALEQQQLPVATELLVKMTNHSIGGAEPPQILARLLTASEGVGLLRPYLVEGSRWLPRVLDSMVALKLPMESGLTLLGEAGAKGIAKPETVRSFIRSLKGAGQWADAYGLWLTQQRQPVPILFNGSFENKFQPDGFDWEITPVLPSRAGALVAQRGVAGRGQVLETQYTGRAVAVPVIRQHLFIAPGRYVLKGQYMGSKLRMEQGLAWAVRCTDGPKTLAGRSGALQDTAGAWDRFQFEFDVPPGCGVIASLQLETFAPFEAAAGFRGKASFDSFELQSVGM
jgi:hypothetical protein